MLVAVATTYTEVIAQIRENEKDITAMKAEMAKKDATDKELRERIYRDQADIKRAISDTNRKLDTLIEMKLREAEMATRRR